MNIEEKIKELMKEKEQIEDKIKHLQSSKMWEPQYDEKYWYVSTTGQAYGSTNLTTPADIGLMNNENFYQTKEEAEYEALCEKYTRKAHKFIQSYSDEIDWTNHLQHKWYVIYDAYENTLYYENVFGECAHNLYCSSKECCQQMVEYIGEGNFIKYVLRVNIKNK